MLWNGKSSDENARNLPIFLHSRVYWNLFFYGPAAGGRTAIWSGRVNKHKNITDQWRLEYLITFMKFMSVIIENNYEWLIRMTFSCESLSFSLPIKDQRFDQFFRSAGGFTLSVPSRSDGSWKFRKVQNSLQNFTHLGIERDTGFNVAKLQGRSQTFDLR